MIDRLNQREKFLLIVTLSVIAVIVNVFLIKFFISSRASLQTQLTSARAKVGTLKRRESERDLWSKRDALLNKKMPVLADPDVANKALREFISEVARKHTVTLDAPAPGLPVPRENYIALAVKLDAKAPWQAIFAFLLDLQSSERFIALESCELKVNREDKAQLRVTLSVAQWFAPK